MTLSRRHLVRNAAVLGTAAVLPAAGSSWAATPPPQRPAPSRRRGKAPSPRTSATEPFTVPLHVPVPLRPRRMIGHDFHQLTTAESRVELLPGAPTPIRGYNGQFAPLIVARRGRPVLIRQVNRMDVPFAMHLHGGHVPQRFDGHPMYQAEPGDVRYYHYPNKQRASTLWLHDHSHGDGHGHEHSDSAESIYRGLAATYVLTDGFEDALPLPKGRYDVPLQIRDAKFEDDGTLSYDPQGFADRPTFLVNGRPRPYFEVAARKYRLRLMNTANDRFFLLRLRDGAPMTQIASDGGLLPAPAQVWAVPLWPGERIDVVVDFSNYPVGSQVVLESLASFPGETPDVMRFDVVRKADDPSRVPGELRPAPDLGTPVLEREFRMRFDPQTGRHLINDRVFDMHRVDFRSRLGKTEVWRVVNEDVEMGLPHSMHPHLAQFRILDRNGRPPGPTEAGLKDTVTVAPGETLRFAVKFTDYTGLFMYHCHMMNHVDMGMMGQMEVVR
ncbi:multicopper oxidase family protein [Streptomyces megasporus]|uniref:multicopper oxidase family protein n=1 Tax=Streptomyces megasporus TaxID=44060 RepID=UPI0004E2245A|nr:multicopper oxidase domain-containing protein [Streptomyces megasporus]